MKKILFVLIAITVAAASSAYAQENSSFELSIGLKGVTGAGFYLGKDWKDELSRYDLENQPAITFGGIISFDMNFVRAGIFGFGLQPEFMFCKTGGMRSVDKNDYDYYSLWMADISLYLKPSFKIDTCTLSLLVGPSLGLAMTDIDATYSYNDKDIDDELNTDSVYCVGIGAGLGLDIPMGIGKLEITILCKPYFTSFVKNYDMLQNMVVLSLGYSFTIVK